MIALYDVQPDPSMGVQYRMLELEWSAPTENTAPIDGYKILFRKDEVPARMHLTAPATSTGYLRVASRLTHSTTVLVAPTSDVLAGGADLPRAGSSRTDW